MARDKFGEALGIWHIDVGGADLDLKPKMGDARRFRNIMMGHSKDKDKMFEAFEQYMIELIARDYPEDAKERIAEFVEVNLLQLFTQIMIRFRWSSEEEIENAKKESEQELKKLIGDN